MLLGNNEFSSAVAAAVERIKEATKNNFVVSASGVEKSQLDSSGNEVEFVAVFHFN